MWFNSFMAQRLKEERVKDALREAERARLIQAVSWPASEHHPRPRSARSWAGATRRTLTPFKRAELALRLNPLVARRMGERTKAGKPVGPGQNPGRGTAEHQLAKAAGVSLDTIRKAKVISEKGDEATKQALRRGDISIHAAYAGILRKQEQRREERPRSLGVMPMTGSYRRLRLIRHAAGAAR